MIKTGTSHLTVLKVDLKANTQWEQGKVPEEKVKKT